MNIKEIKAEFGDCDWMRAFLNGYAVDAVLWLMDQVEEQEQIIEVAKKLCMKFTNKVETGRARSKETYADCKVLLKMIEK